MKGKIYTNYIKKKKFTIFNKNYLKKILNKNPWFYKPILVYKN